MRFAKNPHWDDGLRAQTGLDRDVAAFIAADPVASDVLHHIKHILSETLVRMRHEGRPHITIGFGCTGGGIGQFGVPDKLRTGSLNRVIR